MGNAIPERLAAFGAGGALASSRAALVTLAVLAGTLTTRPAGAQTFPVPFPLPPVLPPLSIDTAPSSQDTQTPIANSPERQGADAPPASKATSPAGASPSSVLTAAAMRASSPADREALDRSRIHEAWYGWQTLTADAAAIAVLLVGAAADTTRPPRLDDAPNPRPLAFAAVASGIYLTGPTAIHLAHGDVVRALLDAGLRIALPLAGFGLGALAAAASHATGDGASADGAAGAILGGISAMVIDASALGWQHWSGPEPTAKTPLLGARGSF